MSHRMVVNDPLYGFIQIPSGLLPTIIAHPYFQRLGRICQLGLASFVYPGARHTRFLHSLGAYHLMSQALQTLIQKGHFIFDSEIEAAQAAILLHDIGHGPFSHVLEHTLTEGITHEDISLLAMQRMNESMDGVLTRAISIFQNEYPKTFLHQLICSQLDVDRLDYLCRDSFYTGVHEGNVGSARLIQMLNIVEDRLVIDAKGLFSVENYLMARRLMYWQVYLHKTTLGAEHILRAALHRAKVLAREGKELFCTPALRPFLYNNVGLYDMQSEPNLLHTYMLLDDSDIITVLKVWQYVEDTILSALSAAFVNRRLFKVQEAPISPEQLTTYALQIAQHYHISVEQAQQYFMAHVTVQKDMYSKVADGIGLLMQDGGVQEVSRVSQIVRTDAECITDIKTYLVHAPIEMHAH